MGFVHLHTWSWYSFLRGGSSPASLVGAAAQLGQPGVATNAVTQATRQDFARHDLLNRIGLKLSRTDLHPTPNYRPMTRNTSNQRRRCTA